MSATARTARAIAITAFLVYALTGGGRIVGSDEVTMFEVARALPAGGVVVPEGATVTRADGSHVSKNAAGQAVLALPLVSLSDALARAAHLDPQRATLAARFGASFFDAIVTAVLLAVFYAGARALGVSGGAALAATLMLGFTTPLWVYAKSFMAEPMQGLGLLLTILGAALAPSRPRAGWLAGLGILLAVSVKLSMLVLVAAAALPLLTTPRAWLGALTGLGLALLGHGLYDYARFHDVLETGYGAQATPAAYTTPILVGLYGLLISSGKGVMWFAPALGLAPIGWRAIRSRAADEEGSSESRGSAARRAAWSVLFSWLVGLALYARFQHWAGDGSYGPRYLIPLLPGAFLPVAFALVGARARARTAATILATLGLLVQIGGVAIYFGAQMREAGDYPYTLPLEHPRFMSDSHFNPRFSPIAAHWRMMGRNLSEHLQGRAPRIAAGGTRDPRLGVSVEDQKALLHALDFWWLYLGYAGLPRAPVVGVLALLSLLAAVAIARLRSAYRAEAKTT
jgi:hypothetical protein